MKINMDILRKMQKVNDMCWFNENYIINCQGSSLAVKYEPDESLFEREFGIHNLKNFMALLSCFEESEITFDRENMIISDKNSPSVINYRTSSKNVLKEKIKSDTNANFMLDGCDKLVNSPTGKYIHFKLDTETIDSLITVSKLLSVKDKKSQLSFFKKPEDNKLKLSVIGGENSFQKEVDILDDSTGNGPVDATIYIEKLISFDWDGYIFFDKTVKDVDNGKRISINDMIVYFKNDEHFLKKLITFNKKK